MRPSIARTSIDRSRPIRVLLHVTCQRMVSFDSCAPLPPGPAGSSRPVPAAPILRPAPAPPPAPVPAPPPRSLAATPLPPLPAPPPPAPPPPPPAPHRERARSTGKVRCSLAAAVREILPMICALQGRPARRAVRATCTCWDVRVAGDCSFRQAAERRGRPVSFHRTQDAPRLPPINMPFR